MTRPRERLTAVVCESCHDTTTRNWSRVCGKCTKAAVAAIEQHGAGDGITAGQGGIPPKSSNRRMKGPHKSLFSLSSFKGFDR